MNGGVEGGREGRQGREAEGGGREGGREGGKGGGRREGGREGVRGEVKGGVDFFWQKHNGDTKHLELGGIPAHEPLLSALPDQRTKTKLNFPSLYFVY